MLRLLFILLLCADPAAAADVAVDLAKPLKPADHAASGALYGIAAPGWPPQQFIAAIHPRNFTQMAPGGHQLPNGEAKPVGDALIVAPIAAQVGATVTIRLPDTFPDFPYIWTGADHWNAEVDRIVGATVKADPPNIYAYEIWNEPDWNWQAQWGDFDAIWAATYARIHSAAPHRRIMGPSASKWDEAWMRRFLTSAISSGAVPDVVSWHELDPSMADAIEAHVAAYRALEKQLGLAPHPISINEYGAPRAMADPGALVHYIAQLERAGVDTADLAFWHRPGRLSDLLVPRAAGTGPATDPGPTGAYWLYAWYGGMTGNMVATGTSPGSRLDGFAAYDAAKPRLDIVVGGEAGATTIRASGLAGFGPAVHVAAEATHWTGTDGPAPAPQPLFTGTLEATAGTLSIPLDLAADSDAVHLVVTPAPKAATASIEFAPQPEVRRLEAESGAITGGRKFTLRMGASNFSANRASGGAYVGFFNRPGAALSLPVTVAAAGSYRLSFGYSNGQAAAAAATLTIDGRPVGQLSFPPTQGRELFGELSAVATLPAGSSTVGLSLAAPVAALPAGPSVLEIDRLDISAEGGQ
jgi:hypothetical protein